MRTRHFALIIGVVAGPMVIVCDGIEAVLGRMRERKMTGETTIHEIGLWAIHAQPGDWVDWDQGWLFALSDEHATFMRDGRTDTTH
jgi:hypothetical protein